MRRSFLSYGQLQGRSLGRRLHSVSRCYSPALPGARDGAAALFQERESARPRRWNRERTHSDKPNGLSSRITRLEAVLFLAREPLGTRKLAQLANLADGTEARTLARKLKQRYRQTGRAFQIEEVAGGFQLLTRPQFAPWLRRLHENSYDESQQAGKTATAEIRLSTPAMETLAVAAYRGPVLRSEIEAIRGVQCGEMLRQLLERDLVRIAGRSEELGRPYLYATTKRFLQMFGLSDLDDLPRADRLRGAEIRTWADENQVVESLGQGGQDIQAETDINNEPKEIQEMGLAAAEIATETLVEDELVTKSLAAESDDPSLTKSVEVSELEEEGEDDEEYEDSEEGDDGLEADPGDADLEDAEPGDKDPKDGDPEDGDSDEEGEWEEADEDEEEDDEYEYIYEDGEEPDEEDDDDEDDDEESDDLEDEDDLEENGDDDAEEGEKEGDEVAE